MPNRNPVIPDRTSSANNSPPYEHASLALQPAPESSQVPNGNGKRRSVATPTSLEAAVVGSAARAGQSTTFADAFIFGEATDTWSDHKEGILLGPYDYLDSHPGKDIRSQLIAAFNVWLQVPRESLEVITNIVGMLHTASLLIDDVEDSSLLRRGVPVAHSIFGTAQTINSANYVYFRALSLLQRLRNPPRAIDIFSSELLNLHRGQGMDLFWRDTLTCPTEADYLEMVSNKTGGLFRLAVKLMQSESTVTPRATPTSSRPASVDTLTPSSAANFSSTAAASRATPVALPARMQDDGTAHALIIPLCNTIGLLFQILDDYRNLSSPLYTANKGLAEDLTEGKFSFPVIHAIRSGEQANRILVNILKQKTSDEQVKRYAVRYMEERTRSFAYTRGALRALAERASGLVDIMDAREASGHMSPTAGAGAGSGAGAGAGSGAGAATGARTGDGIRRILQKMTVDEPLPRPAASASANASGSGSGSGSAGGAPA